MYELQTHDRKIKTVCNNCDRNVCKDYIKLLVQCLECEKKTVGKKLD